MQTMPKQTATSPTPLSDDGFSGVPRTLIPQLWPHIWPVLRRTVEREGGCYGECDVMMALLAGEWQCWVYGTPIVSVLVTQVATFPQQRKLIVRFVAGELEPFTRGTEQLLAYAKANICSVVEANHSRPGWARVMPDGWKRQSIVISHEVPL